MAEAANLRASVRTDRCKEAAAGFYIARLNLRKRFIVENLRVHKDIFARNKGGKTSFILLKYHIRLCRLVEIHKFESCTCARAGWRRYVIQNDLIRSIRIARSSGHLRHTRRAAGFRGIDLDVSGCTALFSLYKQTQ